jgi:hypothetical protein
MYQEMKAKNKIVLNLEEKKENKGLECRKMSHEQMR